MPSKRRRFSFHHKLLLAVLFVVHRPKFVLLVSGLLVLISAAFSSWRLNISTNQDDLFSSNVPFFRHYIDFTKDFPENQACYVLIEAKDQNHLPEVSRWVELADAITARLAKEPDFVTSVNSHIPLESLGTYGLLFEDISKIPEDVKQMGRMLPLAKLWGEQPSGIEKLALGGSPMQRFIAGVQVPNTIDAETAGFVNILAGGWNKTLEHLDQPIQVGNQVPDLGSLGAEDPSRLGYYYVPNDQDPTKHVMLIRVYEKHSYTSMGGQAIVINGIRDAINDVAKPYTDFEVGLTGRPVLEADEMVTTDHDSRKSEIAALIAVFVGLAVLLRSIWLAVAAEIALLVGIGWAFGWATISTMPFTGKFTGELNLLSMVFLIALIGIGMDYLIQVLTRYRREAARHTQPRVIWAGVFKYVAAPINTACLGAAGAFFVSVFTNFRGAAELGVIASGGLLLCLATGYTILPAILTLFPAKIVPMANEAKETFSPAYSPESKTSPHWWLILPAIWAVLLLAAIPFARRAHFDPGLLNMQAQNLPSVKLVRKLQTWSAVVLSKDLNKLREVRSAVQSLPTVASTDSILQAYDNYFWLQEHKGDVATVQWTKPTDIETGDLPRLASSAKSLAAKMRSQGAQSKSPDDFNSAAALLDSFAEKLSPSHHSDSANASRLSEWQSAFIDELRETLDAFHPQPLEIDKLPRTIREHLVGIDGQFALYINPKNDLWVQSDLAKFVHQVENAVAKVPDAPPPTGIAINVYHSTSSIEKSFYHATGYALALIFVLVLIDLRNIPQTILAISVLAMGLPMMVALMGYFGISWNFANFFGLPILIGAGHEYGVFMVHRYNEACKDPRRAWQKWDVSDRALLLCAYVTTASFGFFWGFGQHQGLRSLGLVMALGISCIYLATLCMLRPLLLWKLSRQTKKLQNVPVP